MTQLYEPGSVFKLVTFSAALQYGLINPNTVFSVPDQIKLDGSTFHDAEPHPTEQLTATQILAQSSNIGTSEIAQGVGEQRLLAQVKALGFGQPTGMNFPGESPGLLATAANWEPTDYVSLPIGQVDAVSALQVLDAYNTVANGGVYVAPKLVQATVSPSGTLTKTAPSATHTAISPSVDSELTSMLEQVVNTGTGTSAAVPGYTVAGKTGTAQIPTQGHDSYVTGAYMASFVGFAPAVNPTLSMIVVLDRPTPIFGGTVAAPVFSQIMSYALHRYDIPTTPGAHTHARARPRPRRPARPRTSRESPSHTCCGRDAGVSEACNAVGSTMRTVPMNLLFDDIEVIESVGDPSAVEVGGITHDSRRVVPGDLFCCVPGQVSDGHVHATEAVERGAVGLLCEHFIPELLDHGHRADAGRAGDDAPRHGAAGRRLLRVPGAGPLDDRRDRHQRQDHRDADPRRSPGCDGTADQRHGDALRVRARRPRPPRSSASWPACATGRSPTGPATPSPWRCRATRWSSRASRASTSTWPSSPTSATIISTTTARWRTTSRRRRRSSPRRHALRGVVHADDPWGQRLLERSRIPTVAVHHSDATDVVLRPGHTEFTWRGQRITTRLTGAINVDNTLLAAEAALALGERHLGPEEIAQALSHVAPVPGRLQVIAAPAAGRPWQGRPRSRQGPPFTVLVDYAHTPAGLEVVLGEARTLAPGGRVLTVFGCGGNRDRAKRPLMGGVAERLSDLAFVTSDNPRHEDPLAIIEEVLGGIPGGSANPTVVVEPDRRLAIRRALDAAGPGDVVVIAGKGHETYQEIAGERRPFDDAVEARQALAARYTTDPGRARSVTATSTATSGGAHPGA